MRRRILYSGSLSWSPQWCRLSPNLANARNKNKLNSLTHFWALGFLEIIYLVWNPTSSQAKWKEKIGNFVNTLPWIKAEVKDICHTLLDLEWSGVGFLDLAMFLRVFWNVIATSNINSCWKLPIHLWKPMQTQPLSKCMLLACADQSARQRNMGIARNLAKAFDNYLAKDGYWENLFSNKRSGTINPYVSTPNNSWTTQRMCQSKKHCLSQLMPKILSCNFGGKSQEQQWHLLWSILENMQWKEMHELLYFGLGVGWHWKASAWTSETWNLHKPTKIINSSTVAGTLTGVPSNLSNPDWFWRSRSAWASL